ncbi:hypothetical protein [Krasilnikovia sp. M28-CT-15]|uniref:hypothetical protein n=1 Tax=Krasilnikovia sp. M28-CT-15 TaxID=3373540 RepID=UPI00387613C3
MRTVGFFRELEPKRPEVFVDSLVEAVRPEPSDREDDIVNYLENGIPLVDIMESSRDVISGDRYVSGAPSILSDGVWVWRQDLPYYVQRYHLSLDPEFVRHAARSSFRITEQPLDKLQELAATVLRDVLDMS